MPTSPATAAIVLLLNGVQLDMPHPALLVGGVGCIPVRPVVERLGGQVNYRPGRSISAQLGADAIAFPLAEAGHGPSENRAVSIGGVVYVSGRDFAAALGGLCRWQPELRALDLLLPPTGGAGSNPLTGPSEAVLEHGRPRTLAGRIADRSAALLSPTLGSPDFPPRSVMIDTLSSLTKCSSQDNEIEKHFSGPLSGRGHGLRLEGRWEMQGSDPPVFLAWGLQEDAEGFPGPEVAQISAHRRLYVREEEVVFLLRRSGPRPPQGCVIALSEPSGETLRVTVADEAWRRAEIGNSGAVWSGHVVYPLPHEEGRRGLGLWSASLLGPDEQPEARCWFLVAPGGTEGGKSGGE
ncbi:MAG: hypothetical protein HPY44_06975 [Armatimonadetes bacterium]|nr:hypothetical protein [Armatimonadota bacterium]